MKITKCISQLVLVAAMVLPGIASAITVVFPALDIQDKGDDTGAMVTTTTFDIDATMIAILTAPGTPIDGIPEKPFSLNSTSGSYDPLADGGFGYGVFAGTFTVGGGLLSGTFSNLEVFGFGNGIDFDFEAVLVFTAGSLKGGFDGGTIDGSILGLGVDGAVIAKLGAVSPVPVPAAVWLFGSGLLGLVGIARRKAA